jgi:hypothetical protein
MSEQRVNLETVEQHVTRWQEILRLRDWDIRSMIVEKPWRKTGDVKIDTSNRMAMVMINGVADPSVLEEVVVHELVHVKLYGLDQMIEALMDILYADDMDARKKLNHAFFMELLEETTEDLAKGYLEAAGRWTSPNFTRVDRQVARELGDPV